ncbi:DUF4136 domain-containing protein [Sphingomonas koreensis]|nr:DUF4136 domain-containing protein [Sphingomonas koreensis]
MRATTLMLTTLGALALSGCATTPPVEVTRFHLGEPLARGTIDVEPFTSAGPASLEYKTYAAAVQGELLRVGYAAPPAGATAQYLATVTFRRASRGVIDEGPPVTLGLGVGSFGRHVGGGAEGGIGIGKHRMKELIVSELSVRITDRATGSAVWEGRAQRNGAIGTEAANPAVTAAKLSSALFQGFPGESGRTIRVK